MSQKYAFKDYNPETMARSIRLSASVSTKHCIEICTMLRGKKVSSAKDMLAQVIDMKKPVPFRRFKLNVGHKPGMGPGRYPVKACGEVLKVVSSCEANALNKGLNTDTLKIVHISANLAARPWHYGRARRRKMKRTHVEVVMQETEKKKTKENGPKKNTIAKNKGV